MPDLISKRPFQGRLSGFALLAGVTLSFLICFGLLVYGSGRGLDLTDETFYLIWARDPNAYVLMYQPFGYLLHPLFSICGGHLQAYRLAGFAISAIAGAVLGRSIAPERNRTSFSIYGATSALTIFFPWIITPSYNSAANVGAMMTIAGILNARSSSWWRCALGSFVGAAGLCISAFTKPPLFAVSVAMILMFAMLSKNARVRLGLLASVALGAALVCLFVSPADLLQLMRRIVVTQQVLSLPNTPTGLPFKVARDWLIVPPSLTLSAISAALAFVVTSRRWAARLGFAAAAFSLYYVGSIVPAAIDGSIPDFLGLSIVSGVAGYANIRRGDPELPLIPIALLLGAPAAVALGTFNNQWDQMTFSMAFPLLALFLVGATDAVPWRRLIGLALAIAGPLAVTVLAAFYPYSLQDSVFAQQIPIEHPITHDEIKVDEDTATFVESARGAAKGSLLIDLSGTGPGVAAVLGARAPILPWLNPATPTWPDVVWSRLTLRQRAQAWFVGPVKPLFDRSAPSQWLVGHWPHYCRTTLDPMTFWDREQTLEVWRPCSRGAEPFRLKA